jgi:hypothetical protein
MEQLLLSELLQLLSVVGVVELFLVLLLKTE